jgi:lysozyme
MDYTQLTAELARDEGVRLKPYRCMAGKLTIGIGRNLDDVGVSAREAEAMLRADIARTEEELDKLMPWWRQLDEVRQRVVLNMAFNMGAAEVSHWRNWHALLQAQQWGAAADSMLQTLWARQVGPRATRLAAMVRTGITTGVNA